MSKLKVGIQIMIKNLGLCESDTGCRQITTYAIFPRYGITGNIHMNMHISFQCIKGVQHLPSEIL